MPSRKTGGLQLFGGGLPEQRGEPSRRPTSSKATLLLYSNCLRNTVQRFSRNMFFGNKKEFHSLRLVFLITALPATLNQFHNRTVPLITLNVTIRLPCLRRQRVFIPLRNPPWNRPKASFIAVFKRCRSVYMLKIRVL